ncbi:hypothetical protein LZ198_15630 [Myxococcus sp. K15C18031901]|uniref:hypothetical protein n=1 Tax=Myxococcus dinghuensis TaxID=2906761 RepID=UPI0020A73BF7|nr:hypothetical protein [Myxococcus dinghuensis]MCP3100301.1 hypothetical protein [Myxococcus dinghuensis]
MSAHYRLVQFLPDPFSGARVPIAALVRDADRRVQVARAPHVPGPHCVGGKALWVAMQMAIEELDRATRFDMLPPTVGPHVRLDHEVRIPESISNPAHWVQSTVLPQRPPNAEDQLERAPRTRSRDKQGDGFFRNFRVQEYVRKGFDGSELGLNPLSTPQITHWVPGDRDLLLMEPVVFRENLHAELREISTTFLAWQSLFAERIHARVPHLIAYVLPSAHADVTARTRAILEASRAEVVDVSVPVERMRFIDTIRQVGRSGGMLGSLL